jgi:DNA-binding LacI/PurR family transcriptional regulator
MAKPVTLREVAREAQVSPVAISRYPNGPLELPQSTARESILRFQTF